MMGGGRKLEGLSLYYNTSFLRISVIPETQDTYFA